MLMRAAVVTRYGPPENAQVVDLPLPFVGPGMVLIRVAAAAVTSADARIRGARFPQGFGLMGRAVFGIRGPRRQVLGSAFAGTIEAVGRGVFGHSLGHPVCGMAGLRMGAHAGFIAVSANQIVPRPANVGVEAAAGVLFGGMTALPYLRDRLQVRPGMSVLIVGGSGAVGTNAIQIARLLGAEVTAVTSSRNQSLVESLGAGRVFDYTHQDIGLLKERFDVVMDTVGSLSICSGLRLLTPEGRLALLVADLADTLRARGRVVAGPAPERPSDAAKLLEWVANGELAVINQQILSLEEIGEAYKCVDSGRKIGNILVHT